MPPSATPTVTSETAALMRIVMSKLGTNGPITLGNPATGETCPLPPHISDLIRQVLASLATGHDVTISENLTELTPNEAASFLNVSRMYVMKLINDGTLPRRMVGNHHRIPYADLVAYKRQERARQRQSMDALYALGREQGLIDGPPPRETFRSDDGRGA